MEAFYTMSVPAKFALVFIALLAGWGIFFLWRRLTRVSLAGRGPRGRQPRLAVIDAASVDGRRQLVLVRRDNVEHLLLIGGPTDIVVEPNVDKAAAAVPASPAPRDIKPSPALESLSRPSPTYEPILPITREPISRESISREPISREPIHRPAATYEPAPRPSPTFEPAPALEETHWPAPEPVAVAPAEPLHTSWPAPEPVAVSPLEPSRTSWPTPEPAAPVPAEPLPFEPLPVEPRWPAPEPVAATAVEPPHVSPHVSWPAPEPVAPMHVEPPHPREAAVWPFEEDAIAPPLMPTPVEPEPVIPPPPPPPPPAFEPVFPMSEGRRMPAAPPLPPRNGQDDASNLTEMAQRLEAALRRPIRPVERTVPPVPHVAIEVPPPEPIPPPPPPPPAPPPLLELNVVPQPVAAPEPIVPIPQPPPVVPSPRPAPVFTSIEDEMASLLGRSPGRP
jgi:flagellar protein FliO/FliZ